MLKHQRTIDGMLGATSPATEEVEVEEQDQEVEGVYVTGPVPLSELGAQEVEAMKKVWETMYFSNVGGIVSLLWNVVTKLVAEMKENVRASKPPRPTVGAEKSKITVRMDATYN